MTTSSDFGTAAPSSAASSSSSSSSSPAANPAGPGLRRVCAVADLAEESALGVEIDGEPVCVVRSGGRFYAVRDECSHAEVALSEGEVENGLIECWLHGSQFDLTTGEPTSLPAIDPVPTYPVTIDGDDVLVDLHTTSKRG